VQIALDPYMFRTTPLTELPGLVADLGYEHIELSPRELGCTVMNSEFNGRPEQAARSEGQFWRSMEELLPVFEREGVRLVLEPHTFHMGGDLAGVIEYAGPLLTHLHVADSFDHRASSGLRYIVNPPGSTVRVHQDLDIGQGEVAWGRVLRRPAAAALRRRDDRLCVRVGGSRPRFHQVHARTAEPVHEGLAGLTRTSRYANVLTLPVGVADTLTVGVREVGGRGKDDQNDGSAATAVHPARRGHDRTRHAARGARRAAGARRAVPSAPDLDA
jgi:hypothetical protein